MHLEKTRALNEIPGLDELDAYVLGGVIRRLYLREKHKLSQATDPGVERLLRSIGRSAMHQVKLEPDFYALTVEKEQIIRSLLWQVHFSYGSVTRPCISLYFGMDGERQHTYEECRCHDGLRSYDSARLRQLVEKHVRILAVNYIPIYAKSAFETADKIPIDYLQTSTLSRNALVRAGFQTVADLVKVSPSELIHMVPGFSKKGLGEIEHALALCGFELA